MNKGVWIRSQDKKFLSFTKDVWVNGREIWIKPWNSQEILIGRYGSEKEAVEILDLIESVLCSPEEKESGNGCVFQMPIVHGIEEEYWCGKEGTD